MQTYVVNKLTSFLGVFACIFLTLSLFGYTTTQWQAILLSIIIFGYGHFLLGFYYQLKSFFRTDHPWQSVFVFGVLAVFSVALAEVLFEYAGFVAALFLGFLYFLLHGLLNEQTLIQRQTGTHVPLVFLAALSVFVIALLTYSIPDETFFFDRQLQFTPVSDAWMGYIFETYYMSLQHFSELFWIGVGLSLLTLLYAWFRHGFGRLTFGLAVAISLATLLVVRFGPPAYIYMYLLVVGYHFMTWLLFYLVEMHKRGPGQFSVFVFHNFLILVPLVYGAVLFFQPYPPEWVYLLFDYKLFVIMTYVHISTSFMNDAWFKELQARVFARARPA